MVDFVFYQIKIALSSGIIMDIFTFIIINRIIFEQKKDQLILEMDDFSFLVWGPIFSPKLRIDSGKRFFLAKI